MKAFHYTSVPAQGMEGLESVSIRWAVGRNVGAPNFALRVIDVQPGAATEHHGHAWEHEVFVLEGQGAVVHSDGVTETAIGPGSCVYIPPDEGHQFANRGDTVLRFICVVPYPPGM
ncbi:MAG TPA: cupin domain-containing protein [Chloroflexi bacterium]|jgi:quercetin dioxygenase-like cupin family protein|nr:cupin domain-containing protein [Chloroflexota bacterium]